jgi:cytochrome c oxidase subunit III
MRASARLATTGAWLASGSILTLFSALASALVIRRGIGGDWTALALPGVLWLNTALLAASGVVAELRHWGWAAALGAAFLAGQAWAWQTLGHGLASGPAAAFFFLLTGVHGAHVAGGVAALIWNNWRATPGSAAAVRIYWHTLGAIWMVVLCLLLWAKS